MDALGNYLGMALYRGQQNPALSYFEGMKAAEVPIEMQLRGAQAQKAIGELEKERQLQTGMQGVDLSAPGGFEKAIGVAGKIDPIFAMKLQAVKQNMDVEHRKAFSENLNSTMSYMNNALKGVTSLPAYAGVYSNVLKMNPELAAGMPNPASYMNPDGSVNNEKFQNDINMMTNRAAIVKGTLDFQRQYELEKMKETLRLKIEGAKDERQLRMFQQQSDLLDKRLASQSLATRQEDIGSVVEGLKEGTIIPSMLSKRNTKGEYTAILSAAQREGLNLPKLQLQYEAAKKWAGSMNSQQMVRYRGLAGSVVNTIDDVKALANQMNLGGFTPLNYAEIEALMKTRGNTPMGQLATQYVTAVNTLKEEFANLAQGGYAPTEAVWKLANRQVNENYGVKQMHASLDEIKRLVNFRTTAFENIQPWGAGQMGGAPPAKAGEQQLPDVLPPGSTLVPGFTPNGKPVYKTPDGKYLEKQ